ncbi:winged helix-turn-helix domain-containing protein [Halomarina rubra]|uniref:Winged helix-turn-helix domain-containing protein n=1 Tax=Halomarina rubra TaxID=2071873 RepID=A0ABD6AVR1_9EURY|nr:winged helix-turn-helix domain-containing protein [Halomarina rubra]
MSDAVTDETTDVDPDALDVLGDETRRAILLALVEHRRVSSDDATLSFSALRERVGVADSGRFNYHLGKLVDRFVEKTDGGYRLSYAGQQVVGAALAGTYSAGESKGPTDVGECPVCETTATATYEEGVLEVTCANDHVVYRVGFPPGAAADRSMERLLALSARLTYDDIELAIEGVCPECLGTVTRSLQRTGGDEEVEWFFDARCERCGQQFRASAGVCVLTAPSFVAFAADHDADPREQPPWTFATLDGSQTVVSEDPLRVRMTIDIDDETFSATLDEHGRTVATDRS